MSCGICDHFRAAIAKDIFGGESLFRLKAEFREHLAYKVFLQLILWLHVH